MGTDKRARQKANRQAAMEYEQAEESRQRRNRRLLVIGGLVVIAVFFIGLVILLIDQDDGDVAQTDPATTTTAEVTTSEALTPVVITVPPPGDTITGETPCPADDGSEARVTQFENPPPMCIDPTQAHTAEMVTSEGTIVLDLDAAIAPETVNNFVVLSRYHYYDGVAFHRVLTDFMIQGGDAVGPQPGTGGPGYEFADELPGEDYVYVPGDLAMANSGPDTNGSQFFIVTRDEGVDWLAGAHTLFGTVTEGMEVVDAIEALDDGTGTGAPTAEVVIERITITEGEPTTDASTTAPGG